MKTAANSRSIFPNNGRAPATLIGALSLACQVIEGIQNDYPSALNSALIADAKNLMMEALTANEYEEAELKMAGLHKGTAGERDTRYEG